MLRMPRRTFLKSVGVGISAPALGFHGFAADSSPSRGGADRTRVLSCNIRVALPEDEATGNGWASRRDLCVEVIKAQNADLICLQEVLQVQMEDLEKGLPDFTGFGFVGPEMDTRKEGYQGIAKNPVFYSKRRYDFVSAGGFWLSETPHLPGSLSWGSARARHVNWVRLRERNSGRQLRVLSLHLDHVSQEAREEQIKMVLAEAALYPPDFPQILAGDFNAGEANPVLNLVADAGWTNTHTAAPGPRDNGLTVHSFLGPNYVPKTKSGGKRGPIDFILTHGPVKTLGWKVIRDSRDGRYPSDHYFISADLALQTA